MVRNPFRDSPPLLILPSYPFAPLFFTLTIPAVSRVPPRLVVIILFITASFYLSVFEEMQLYKCLDDRDTKL